MLKKKILIIGGAGFLGFHLAKKLLNKYKVDIIDDLSRGKLDKDFRLLLKNKNVNLIKKDISKKINLNFFKKDYKYIFQLAAIVGVKNVLSNPFKVIEKNLMIQMNSIKIAQNQKKLKKFLFTSTSEVHLGNAQLNKIILPTSENHQIILPKLDQKRSTYMLSKIIGENMLHNTNLNYLILRPNNIFGERMGMSHVIPELIYRFIFAKKNSLIKIDNHNHFRSFCYIEDAMGQILKLTFSSITRDVFNIGNDKNYIKIFDLAKIIQKITKRNDLTVTFGKFKDNSPKKRLPSLKKIKSKINIKLNKNLKRDCVALYKWYSRKFYEDRKNY